MATASENQLDVKIILMNNDALGLAHQSNRVCSYKQGVFAATYPEASTLCRLPPGLVLDTL